MSKKFEQALEGLPTMSQFMFKEHCEEERLRHMFTAGRALGRREIISVVKTSCDQGCPPPNVPLDCDSCITCIHQQITEAIPEEAIDQPQEDVCCEWVACSNEHRIHYFETSCGTLHGTNKSGGCPYCGKPIKVKE